MDFRTNQERVDSLTMKITNPNVVGSGYIEHPPQVPFADRLLMQPTTVDASEVPEWFSSGSAPRGGHRGGYGGRGRGHEHQGYGSNRNYSTGGGYQNTPNGGGYHGPSVPGYAHAPASTPHRGNRDAARSVSSGHNGTINPPQRTPVLVTAPPPQQHGVPQRPHRGPRPQGPVMVPSAAAPKAYVATGVFDTSSIMNALQQTTAPAATHPTAVASHQPVVVPDKQDDDKKLSKSQKAKLRKKLREGKA